MMTYDEGPFWRPPQSTRKELRQFGLLFTVIAAAVAGWMFWQRGVDSPYLPGSIAVVLLAISLLWPTPLKPFWWPWMVFVHVLGFVNSHLLLALVLFLLFTPIGWVLRLFGKKLIDRDFQGARRIAGEGGTLWRQREASLPDSEHFKRQF
ncbi:MAG: SxtJ family membrane protein [SAR202 cluster bacterium]|nr:SxtJ family membrane protein [SAR202 cluster bacterium]